MMHLYSEHNPYRAAVLRERIEDGLLPPGVVDERDIETIPDQDFLGYTQVHLFAGIGGFPLGMRRAGFPEHIRIVDGGFPCQDISNAGKRAGITGARSGLWREMVRCIRVVRPHLVFVENVAALLGRGMGVVLGDLAEIGYDAEGDCISAADVGAPHLRRRIWIVAHAAHDGRSIWPDTQRTGIPDQQSWDANLRSESVGCGGEISDAESLQWAAILGNESHGILPHVLADAHQRGCAVQGESSGRGGLATRGGEAMADANGRRCEQRDAGERRLPESDKGSVENAAIERLEGLDVGEMANAGEGRQHAAPSRSSRWPVEPDVGRVAHGIPKRVDRLAALGDAIVPQCVEEVLRRLIL
jgi:DNA (cytosine-5)-methyltransferase 1